MSEIVLGGSVVAEALPSTSDTSGSIPDTIKIKDKVFEIVQPWKQFRVTVYKRSPTNIAGYLWILYPVCTLAFSTRFQQDGWICSY